MTKKSISLRYASMGASFFLYRQTCAHINAGNVHHVRMMMVVLELKQIPLP